MSETLILHCQEYFDFPQEKTTSDQAVVTGVELPGQSFLRGFHYDPHAAKEVQIPLEWEPKKAENLAEYYQRHLTVRNEGAPGWNCHSFAAAIMGWEVAWDNRASPYHMPSAISATHPTQLQDQQSYVLRRHSAPTRHAVIGMPNPVYNISVWGFRSPLKVTNNYQLLKVYSGDMYRHVRPIPFVNRVASLSASYRDHLPDGPHRYQEHTIQVPRTISAYGQL